MKIGSNRRTRAATAARPSWRQRRHSPERHDPGAHPALERRKRLRLAQERGQEDRHGAGLEHLAAELAIEGLVPAVDPPIGVRVSHLDTFGRLR
jgi:hypothetical protein